MSVSSKVTRELQEFEKRHGVIRGLFEDPNDLLNKIWDIINSEIDFELKGTLLQKLVIQIKKESNTFLHYEDTNELTRLFEIMRSNKIFEDIRKREESKFLKIIDFTINEYERYFIECIDRYKDYYNENLVMLSEEKVSCQPIGAQSSLLSEIKEQGAEDRNENLLSGYYSDEQDTQNSTKPSEIQKTEWPVMTSNQNIESNDIKSIIVVFKNGQKHEIPLESLDHQSRQIIQNLLSK